MATREEILERARSLQREGAIKGGSVSTTRTGAGNLGTSTDLRTSEGLYNLAVRNGLQADADRLIRAQSGEDVNKIFSGGFISDIFDTLNILQYGVTGMLKGKSFSEGVRTRQSFSDKDALGDNGIPGVVTGLALDILVDPLTWIAPATVARKLPFLGKAATAIRRFTIGDRVIKSVRTGKTFKTAEEALKAAQQGERFYSAAEGGTKLGSYVASKLSYRFGQDPVYQEILERSGRQTAALTKRVIEWGEGVAKISPKAGAKLFKTIDDQGRLGRESIESLRGVISDEELDSVARLYNYIDVKAQQQVDLGLLSAAKKEETVGEYIKQAYEEYELTRKSLFRPRKSVEGSGKRVEVLSADRIEDRIENPAYLLMNTAIKMTRDIENAKMFRALNKNFGNAKQADGFVQVPKTKNLSDGFKYGELAGSWIPKYMFEGLETVMPKVDGPLAGLERSLVGNFKFFKVVMNPATHIRNIISNRVLNYWKLGMNPLDPRTIRAEKDAIMEIARKGGKYIDEATPHGYNMDTFAVNELKNLLNTPEVASGMKGIPTKTWQKIKKQLSSIYQGEENHAKLTAYIYQRRVKKLSPERAWKAAESATFNYAQVTPFIRKLRESIFGFPFITFTYKATPLALETAYKNPQRIGVIGKMKNAIEEAAGIEQVAAERENEPPWVKDGFYIRLPGEDPEGRARYFDLTYILPFGDLISGQFLSRGTEMQTGTPESVGRAAIGKNPFLNLVGEIGNNEDFYGKKIMNDSDPMYKQHADLLRHIMKTYAPPLAADLLPGGYNDDGTRDLRGFREALQENDGDDMKRTLPQEFLRQAGIKIQPIDADIQAQYAEWNRQKALRTLLNERGLMDQLIINYETDD